MANELIEGKYSVKSIYETAEKVVAKKTACSSVLDVDAERRIPKFRTAELTIGRVLGRGGFCVVSEISKIELHTQKNNTAEDDSTSKRIHDEHAIHNIVQDRSFMATHCLRGKGNDCRYAIKRLQDSSKKNAQTFVNGIVDLAVEARFLSIIRHPNIIKMRAMAASSPYSIEEPFFVVLDRLYDILGVRVAKWKRQRPGSLRKLLDRKNKRENAFWMERITVGYDLACALQYLHDMNIIYRDIKPDNIGFDVRGDVKIFDFGLAKEINPANQDESGFYKLTEDTGSPRYMAVEVALGEPYNELVDVYSFCILLWQILQMETPFEGFTMSMFQKRVVQGGARPVCDPRWPSELVQIMQSGWGDKRNRPAMSDVASVLRDEMNKYSDMDELTTNSGGWIDASRKSELSLRGGSMASGGSSKKGKGK